MNIIKRSGLEESTVIDSYTGMPIRVSTTARKVIRESSNYKNTDPMSNASLNDYISGAFKSCGAEQNILHYFLSKGSTYQNPQWIEIRRCSHPDLVGMGINFFFSVLKGDSIDIITMSSGFVEPKKPRKIKFK